MDVGKKYNIVNGPNKDQIFEACKHTYDKVPIDLVISFGIVPPENAYYVAKTENTRFSKIEYEDGSGEKLNLAGYCEIQLPGDRITSREFEAFYNAKTHEGQISFR